MNEPDIFKSMDPSTLLVPIVPLGFHPESLPRHHSAFAAVLGRRKFDNNNSNGIYSNISRFCFGTHTVDLICFL